MSGHVVDRFVRAAWPDWPEAPELPDGAFYVSPEISRMLHEHARRFHWHDDGQTMFGRDVIVDRAMSRGEVTFKGGARNERRRERVWDDVSLRWRRALDELGRRLSR